MSVDGQGFGCRPLEGRRGISGGRRRKASKGGNRAGRRRKAPRARAKSGSNATSTSAHTPPGTLAALGETEAPRTICGRKPNPPSSAGAVPHHGVIRFQHRRKISSVLIRNTVGPSVNRTFRELVGDRRRQITEKAEIVDTSKSVCPKSISRLQIFFKTSSQPNEVV